MRLTLDCLCTAWVLLLYCLRTVLPHVLLLYCLCAACVVLPSVGYNASDGRKQRKRLLAELKGLLPPSHTPLLVALLLQGSALQLAQQHQGKDTAARTAQTTGVAVS